MSIRDNLSGTALGGKAWTFSRRLPASGRRRFPPRVWGKPPLGGQAPFGLRLNLLSKTE